MQVIVDLPSGPYCTGCRFQRFRYCPGKEEAHA